jgi:hypothetical protein
VDPQLAVHNRVGVSPHPGRTGRVSEAERAVAHEIDEILLAVRLWPGNELGLADPVERLLACGAGLIANPKSRGPPTL